MFCSSDSAQKLLKTSVIPLGDVESSTSTVHLRDGLFGHGQNALSWLGHSRAPFEVRILPFARDFLLFSDFVLRRNRSSPKMGKLENLSVCRDEHTTRCLDWRLWRLSGTAPD
jgi:hypothetical protein